MKKIRWKVSILVVMLLGKGRSVFKKTWQKSKSIFTKRILKKRRPASAKKASKRRRFVFTKRALAVIAALSIFLALAGVSFGIYHWSYHLGYVSGIVETREERQPEIAEPEKKDSPRPEHQVSPLPGPKILVQKDGNYEFLIIPTGAKVLVDERPVVGYGILYLTRGWHSYWPDPQANVTIIARP